MELGIFDVAIVIQMSVILACPSMRVTGSITICCVMFNLLRCQDVVLRFHAPKRVRVVKSGVRPASNSLTT